MSKQQFMWINGERIRKSRTVDVYGLEIEVELSPFETPTSIRGRHLPHIGFVIDFDYIDSEPSVSNPEKVESVEFLEGRHTGKLLRITIPVDDAQYKNVAVIKANVNSALRYRGEQIPLADQTMLGKSLNNEFVSTVLDENIEELVG